MQGQSPTEFGPFLIDVRERVLLRDGEPVPLTPKAFDLLAAFVEQPGRLFSKEELLQKVWPDTFVEESNLAYNVFALRKALGDTAEHARYIETVPKRGYRFRAPVTPIIRGTAPATPDTAANTNDHVLSIAPPGDAMPLPLERGSSVPPATARRTALARPSWLSRRLALVGLVVLVPMAVAYAALEWWRTAGHPEPLRAVR